MFVAGVCAAGLSPSASAAIATPQDMVELTLPRAAAADEAVWLQVRAGALPRGTEIQVSTSDGVLLGTVSPFGGPRGHGATYTIPLPKTAVRDGRVRLRFEVHEAGAPARPPRPGEVESVSLIYVPVSN